MMFENAMSLRVKFDVSDVPLIASFVLMEYAAIAAVEVIVAVPQSRYDQKLAIPREMGVDSPCGGFPSRFDVAVVYV